MNQGVNMETERGGGMLHKMEGGATLQRVLCTLFTNIDLVFSRSGYANAN